MIQKIYKLMTEYYSKDPKRIQHFVKVHSFAKFIGMQENLSEKELFILEAAALVHDIGIKVSLEKYGSSSGKYQEIEGVEPAKKLLSSVALNEEDINRICFLIAHHHTYNDVNGIDYQILLEADFLVNGLEDELPQSAIKTFLEKVFKTKTGVSLCKTMYGV